VSEEAPRIIDRISCVGMSRARIENVLHMYSCTPRTVRVLVGRWENERETTPLASVSVYCALVTAKYGVALTIRARHQLAQLHAAFLG
jgi:hypothetical protein